MQFGQLKRREFIALKQFRSNGPVIASPQRSEGRSNPETTPGLLRRFAPRNDESLGSIPAKPAVVVGAAAWPVASRAQELAGKIPRIGFLQRARNENVVAFVQACARQGTLRVRMRHWRL